MTARGGAVAAFAAAFVVAGCGGDDTGAIERTVEAYLAAVAERDGAAACAELTENAQLGIFEFRRVHVGPDHPEKACARVVRRQRLAGDRDVLLDPRVEDVEFDGDAATARVNGVEATLKRDDGEWKLDVFGLASDVTGDQRPLDLQ